MGHTEFLFCKMIGKNLHESVRPLAICRQAQARAPVRMHSVRAYVMHFHTVIIQNCHLKIWQYYINKLAQNFDSFGYIFNMKCLFCIQSPIYYAMLRYAMLCHAMYHVLYSAIWQRKLKAPHGAACKRQWYLQRFS